MKAIRLGSNVSYEDGLKHQDEAVADILENKGIERIYLLEHAPVYTIGRLRDQSSLREASTLPAPVFETNRGGQATYHGPGQLVGYPVIDLKRHRKDLHWYLRQVEEALIRALGAFGIAGGRSPGYTGVWVGGEGEHHAGGRKIASIGVHARDWVTWHGFALNVETDLSYFDLIVPCGISQVQMTSVCRECDDTPTVAEVASAVLQATAGVFALEPWVVEMSELGVVAET